MTLANNLNQAQRLERDDKLEEAAKVYGDILSRFPKNIKARKALNALTRRMREAGEPSVELRQKVQAGFRAGHFQVTAATCAKLLNSHRTSHFLWDMLGRCHHKLGNLDQAATCLNKACEIDPKSAGTFAVMGDVCKLQGQIPNSIALHKKALALDPNNLNALNNLGNTMLEQGQTDAAAQLVGTAARLAPGNPQLAFNYANILREQGDLQQAEIHYRKAAKLAPEFSEARYNLAQMTGAGGDREAAVENFNAVLEINPGDDRARAQKLHMMAQLNDWAWVDEYNTHRRVLGLRGTACGPFAMMTLEDNPDLLRVRTQAYAGSQFTTLPQPVPAKPARPRKLRIGYFSADFHNHATMQLMGGLFENHDRSRFESYAYSYGPARQDAARGRVEKHASCFRDMAGVPDAAFVAAVQNDDLDIAVDLKGYTGDTRSTLFANRLAPLHVSYLGYPGSMGTTAFDYMIGDPVVCPPGSERYYDEHLIRMPHSYQINDSTRQISGREFSRRECGLPEDGFVFCCFNNSYKITPREFDIWMRLLAQTDDSVLWLLGSGPVSEANLREAARGRGVDPDRLIFAGRIAQEDHLARQKAADLLLDTFTVNAHTTASDALWAGLPVLAMPGRQFAARVSASLLNAVNMPELVTASEAEYEARALELARDPELLAATRAKLKRNRATAPLFDTARFARDLERAFDMAYARHLQGLAPDHLAVPAQDAKTGRMAVAAA